MYIYIEKAYVTILNLSLSVSRFVAVVRSLPTTTANVFLFLRYTWNTESVDSVSTLVFIIIMIIIIFLILLTLQYAIHGTDSCLLH